MFRLFCVETGDEISYKHLTFSGGEEHVTVDEKNILGVEVTIEANLWSSKDVMILLMLTDALRRCSVEKIDLVLKYVPYARQDRVANVGESLSIKVMCDLINAQKYECVEIWDPHSEVTAALLDRVVVRHQHELFAETTKWAYGSTENTNAVIVAPDAGAMKKAYELSSKYSCPLVHATKHRDTKTGKIDATTVASGHAGTRDFWIVDDICDGGFTFTELAKVLRPLTEGKVNLYVTHGIFSKGFAPFIGLIDEIYCANLHPSHAGVDTRGPVKLFFHPTCQ